ncbi:hypothetical protein GCM10010271_67680 [Streptomyces kurssanovii]|nr:hypothetical protein GCM10010271_67680 [Streptomyces kurssanovii]
MMDDYENCDVYVDSDDHVLVRRLLSVIDSQTEMQNRVGDIEISVAHNDYESGSEGFLGWSTVVECTAIHEAAPQSVVSAVQTVLNAFREARIRALPSCYFEDELDF